MDANKVYPRELDKELPTSRGRIKYQAVDKKYAKKYDVLKYLAETIPKLKTRQQKATPQDAEPQLQQGGKKKKNRK